MALFILESGFLGLRSKKVKVNKSGKMDQHMRDFGRTTKHMDLVELFMQMEMFMRATLWMIRRMAMVSIKILMA
jgi:hypothetical protein